MAWDNTKSTASDPDNPNADEQLTASEWNTHVDEGHWPSDELQFQIDIGDPVLVDPQNSNEIVARYDRSSGSWVIDTLEANDVKYSNGPPGAAVNLLTDQTIQNDTVTKIAFDNAARDPDNLLDTNNNSIVIPSGFSYCKVVLSVSYLNFTASAFELLDIRKNAGSLSSGLDVQIREKQQAKGINIQTPWFPVSQGDDITARIRQQSGSSSDLFGDSKTNMEAYLV